MKKFAVVFVAVVGLAAVAALYAQQPGFKRTVVQQGDLSTAGKEVVQAIAEFQSKATVGRHTHPGEEVAYVLEGSILLEVEGKPPVTLTAGKGFIIPAGTIHNATENGAGTSRVLATYIVEKGKPLATPAAK